VLAAAAAVLAATTVLLGCSTGQGCCVGCHVSVSGCDYSVAVAVVVAVAGCLQVGQVR
jgi:hypothetical protein